MMVVEEIAGDRAEEQRVHGAPAEPAPDLETDPDHQDDFQEGGDERRRPDLEQLAETELQAEAEHQEDHPELGEGLDGVFVVNEAEWRGVGADDEARDDVAKHYRLLEPMKKDGDYAGYQHDHRQILDKADGNARRDAPYFEANQAQPKPRSD